jgi:hypothetical protein
MGLTSLLPVHLDTVAPSSMGIFGANGKPGCLQMKYMGNKPHGLLAPIDILHLLNKLYTVPDGTYML